MLGIVVGLAAEARLARGLGCPVGIGGGTAEGAATAARGLIEAGCTGLLSFGLAGGLAPNLPAGALVIPLAVVAPDGPPWRTDKALNAWLTQEPSPFARGQGEGLGHHATPGAKPPSHGQTLFAAPAIIATAAEKARLFHATGAAAADIESGPVAEAAARAGLPFAALRAVCDPAERDLPHAAQTALDAAGRIRPGLLLRSVTRHPGQIGALIALGRDAARARQSLLARVACLGPANTEDTAWSRSSH